MIPQNVSSQGLPGEGCGKAVKCGGLTCVSPTSLRELDTDCYNCDWEGKGKHCGAKKCFVFFSCRCGGPLAGSLCPDYYPAEGCH